MDNFQKNSAESDDSAKKVLETEPLPPVAAMVETIVGCKWSLQMLMQVRADVRRPGAMRHAITGLTQKVQNDCLKRMTTYKILKRVAYPEVPPRVEYEMTAFGSRFAALLDGIAALQADLNESMKMSENV